MSRILVTGCSGFIGSRIAIQAKQADLDIVASTRHSSAALEQQLGMPVWTVDVLQPISLEGNDKPIDAIIHCATANDILSRNFEAGTALSVFGTRNILEFAITHRIKKIIYLSTLQVYGTELTGDVSESTPTYCQSPYALNHFYGEELCRMYAHNHELDIVLLRPSNVYGVPDVSTVRRDSLVPMCFVREAVQTGMITLRSSGQQRRNFISTSELANACLHLLGEFPSGCEVVNLGSDWSSSIRDIAEMTKQIYMEKFGDPLQLSILSENPKLANQFKVNSKVAYLRSSAEQSRRVMVDVITRLFDYYKISRGGKRSCRQSIRSNSSF